MNGARGAAQTVAHAQGQVSARRRGAGRILACSTGLILAAFLGAGMGRCRRSEGAPVAEGDASAAGASVVMEALTAPQAETPRACETPTAEARGAAVPAVVVPQSFAGLAKAADPAVVTIISRIEERLPGRRRRVVGEGLGTGFVYDRKGFILTNHHVIEDGSDVSVRLADGREIPATVVGRDKTADVAVLRVEEHGLVPLPLGDSNTVEVGDWVVAIGNPFGLSHTVSAGILSAKGRTREDVKGLDPAGYFNFMQTDAAINQGNSGGPLLNLRGEVVGINSAIRANANSIGFAIPINMVRELLPVLLRDGKVARSALGVIAEALDEADALRLRRLDRKGALIKKVLPGLGADRAGLAVDDIIIAFDGKMVADANQLLWYASLGGIGKTVTVRVQREERPLDVRVTLIPLALAQAQEQDDDTTSRLGGKGRSSSKP